MILLCLQVMSYLRKIIKKVLFFFLEKEITKKVNY